MMKFIVAAIVLCIAVTNAAPSRQKRAVFRNGNQLTQEGDYWVTALTLWDKFDRSGRLNRFYSAPRGGPREDRIDNWNYVLTGSDGYSKGYSWAIDQVQDMIARRNIANNDLNTLLTKAKAVVKHRQADLDKFGGGDQGHQHAKQEWDQVVQVIQDKINRRG
ncbi:hypothetical protein HDE_13179 [Halotydeus destructor]|nr:hypothetical protein HDE_13179 [Halotydeus destructor]